MTSAYEQTMAPVLQRLQGLQRLSTEEAQLVRSLAGQRVHAHPGDTLTREPPGGAQFLLGGWAAYRAKLINDRSQILRLLTPGDMFGEFPHLSVDGFAVVALTHVTVADAAPVFQKAGAGEAPGLARALALSGREHDAQMATSIIRLGAMSALERMAHLLLELADRLASAGLSDGRIFPLPLTQEMLGETLGLSIVHTNRTLQQLRRDSLIELRSGVAVLLQPAALAKIAGRQPQPRSSEPWAPEVQPRRSQPSVRA